MELVRTKISVNIWLMGELTLLHEKKQVVEPHIWSGPIFEQQKKTNVQPYIISFS